MTLTLDGETRLIPIIGDPIAQVKSPALLSRELASRGCNALVVPMHIKSEHLDNFFHMVEDILNIDGVIATVPHKGASLAHCDRPSRRAVFAGSVNALRRDSDGKWSGDNTDGRGFLDGVAAQGFDIEGKRALLVGVGGAGSAIAYELLARGASWLGIHEVDTGRRDAAIERLSRAFPGRVGVGSDDPRGFDLIGNATPVGMRASDPLPVHADKLVPGQFVADAITKPALTPLLTIAGERGCTTMPGLGMFNAQARILVDFLLGQDLE